MLKFSSVIVFILLTACSTAVKDSFAKITVGSTKSDVLEKVGNPKFTQRENSTDTWIYSYYEGEQEYRRNIIFVDGVVTNIGPSSAYPSAEQELNKTKSLEEYESVGKKIKGKKKENFKDVDGGN